MSEDEELEMIRRKKLDALIHGNKKGDEKMAGTVEVITDSSFESFIKKDKLVVIDCWASVVRSVPCIGPQDRGAGRRDGGQGGLW